MAATKTMIEWERRVLAAPGAPERVAEIETELRRKLREHPSKFPGLPRPTVLSGWCMTDRHKECEPGGTCDCLCHP